MEIERVTVEELKDGYYRYFAHYADGSKEVIRKKASRRYNKAYQYTEMVTSGNKSGLALHFTFGKKPSKFYTPIKTFNVTAESEPRTWQPGDRRIIFHDPVTEKDPEGEAVLLKKQGEDPPETKPHMEMWDVMFLDDGFKTQRYFQSK